MSDKKVELKRDGTMQISSKEGESVEAGKMDEPLTKKQKTMTSDEKATSKRISSIIKMAKEGEELLKDMGHKDDNPDSDRRRTRSQTRGVPPPPPLAPKKERVKNVNPKPDGTKSRGRGRPKKSEKREEIVTEAAKDESSVKKDGAIDEMNKDVKENKRDENGAKKFGNDTSESQKQNPILSTEKSGQEN